MPAICRVLLLLVCTMNTLIAALEPHPFVMAGIVKPGPVTGHVQQLQHSATPLKVDVVPHQHYSSNGSRHARDQTVYMATRSHMLSGSPTNITASPVNASASPSLRSSIPLSLCNCTRAKGPPAGLGCGDKLGFFVTGFEKEGTWMAGGGLVPLSHAVCCRPCLPYDEAVLAAESRQATGAGTAAGLTHAGSKQPAGDATVAATAAAIVSSPTMTPQKQQLPTAVSDASDTLTSPGFKRSRAAEAVAGSPYEPITAVASSAHPPSAAAAAEMTSVASILSASEAVAVISYGCHPSSGMGALSLQCESEGVSFVTGFAGASRVSFIMDDEYYPLDQVSSSSSSSINWLSY